MRHSNTFQAFANVYRAGGVRGLWTGCSPNMCRALFASTSQVRTEKCLQSCAISITFSKQFAHQPLVCPNRNTSTQNKELCICIYVYVYQTITNYLATMHMYILIFHVEMASYDHTKHLRMNHGIFEEGFGVHVAASFVAGFCCSVCSAPVDNIKTRIMNQIGGKYA